MSPEELDQWRGQEARRLRRECPEEATEVIAARLAREGWTPPAPVDPDVLAFREWFAERLGSACKAGALAGHRDNCLSAHAYLAGARMAREQERERAKGLVEYVQDRRHEDAWADRTFAKYRGEA